MLKPPLSPLLGPMATSLVAPPLPLPRLPAALSVLQLLGSTSSVALRYSGHVGIPSSEGQAQQALDEMHHTCGEKAESIAVTLRGPGVSALLL